LPADIVFCLPLAAVLIGVFLRAPNPTTAVEALLAGLIALSLPLGCIGWAAIASMRSTISYLNNDAEFSLELFDVTPYCPNSEYFRTWFLGQHSASKLRDWLAPGRHSLAYVIRTTQGARPSQDFVCMSPLSYSFIFFRSLPDTDDVVQRWRVLHELGHLSILGVSYWNRRHWRSPLILLNGALLLFVFQGFGFVAITLIFAFVAFELYYHFTYHILAGEIVADTFALQSLASPAERREVLDVLQEIWDVDRRRLSARTFGEAWAAKQLKLRLSLMRLNLTAIENRVGTTHPTSGSDLTHRLMLLALLIGAYLLHPHFPSPNVFVASLAGTLAAFTVIIPRVVSYWSRRTQALLIAALLKRNASMRPIFVAARTEPR
jgi:hypothetical protein